jgi:hypothetical protein
MAPVGALERDLHEGVRREVLRHDVSLAVPEARTSYDEYSLTD